MLNNSTANGSAVNNRIVGKAGRDGNIGGSVRDSATTPVSRIFPGGANSAGPFAII